MEVYTAEKFLQVIKRKLAKRKKTIICYNEGTSMLSMSAYAIRLGELLERKM